MMATRERAISVASRGRHTSHHLFLLISMIFRVMRGSNEEEVIPYLQPKATHQPLRPVFYEKNSFMLLERGRIIPISSSGLATQSRLPALARNTVLLTLHISHFFL